MEDAALLKDTVKGMVTCTICLEIFEKPKVLPCLHSFCTDCIVSWIKKQKNAYFSCPTCRRCVDIPGNGVREFPDDFNSKKLAELFLDKDKAKISPKAVEEIYANMPIKQKTMPEFIKHVKIPLRLADSVVKINNMIVAIRWHRSSTPSDVFVEGGSEPENRELRRQIQLHCIKAHRLSVVTHEKIKKLLVVCVQFGGSMNDIKLITPGQGEVTTLDVRCTIAGQFQDGSLMCATINPSTLQKITEKGNEVLFENDINKPTLAGPLHLCVNINDDIIVSDIKKASVLLFNQNGRLFNTYKPELRAGQSFSPKGVCCDPRGNIYVADKDNNSVHRLDINGKFQETILSEEDGVSEPLSLHWEGSQLLIGQAECINIFEFS